MSNIPRKIQRSKQPTKKTDVLASIRNLCVLSATPDIIHHSTSGAILTRNNSAKTLMSDAGLAYVAVTGDDYVKISPVPANTIVGAKRWTLIVKCCIKNTTANTIVAQRYGGGSGYVLRVISSKYSFYDGTAWRESSLAVTVGEHTLIVTSNGDGTGSFIVDGTVTPISMSTSADYGNQSYMMLLGYTATSGVEQVEVGTRISYVGMFNTNLPDALSIKVAADSNPWLLFEPRTRSISVPAASGGTDVSGSSVTQTNSSTSDAVVQTEILVGSDVTQANNSTNGFIEQIEVLTGSNATQVNSSTSDAVVQTETLVGSDVTQANNSTNGFIEQIGGVTGSNATQANSSTSDSIVQTETLTGSDVTQDNSSTSSFMEIAGGTDVSGSSATQVNGSTSGVVVQTEILTGSTATQANGSTSQPIIQIEVLTGSNATQVNSSTNGAWVGATAQTVTGSNATQYNETTNASLDGGSKFGIGARHRKMMQIKPELVKPYKLTLEDIDAVVGIIESKVEVAVKAGKPIKQARLSKIIKSPEIVSAVIDIVPQKISEEQAKSALTDIVASLSIKLAKKQKELQEERDDEEALLMLL